MDNGSDSLDSLERSLHQSIDDKSGASQETERSRNIQLPAGAESKESVEGSDNTTDGSTMCDSQRTTTEASNSSSTSLCQPQNESSKSKYLALCVNTGGIYKTLAEIDATGMTSDRAGFQKLKERYLKARGFRSKFSFLMKPVTLEFVQVSQRPTLPWKKASSDGL